MLSKKIINNIDICCFKRIYQPKWTHSDDHWSCALSIMGTSDSFAKLKEMLLKQLAMAKKFSSSAYKIQFKKPWEFSHSSFDKDRINNLNHGNRRVRLHFFEDLQLKLITSPEQLDIKQYEDQIRVVINENDFTDLIAVCDFRQIDQTHGRGIGEVVNHLCLEFPPFGDFLGID